MAWEEQWGTGRCINCGFLGKRDKISSVSECYSATAVDRLTGILNEAKGDIVTPFGMGVQRAIISTYPWCFIGKADFLTELETTGAKVHQADKVQEILKRDRGCESWYKWTEFVSPKEHFEEFKMLQLEQKRQEFEQRIEADRRKFELELQRLNEQSRKRTDNIMAWLTIAAVIFALCQLFVAILGVIHNS